MIDIPIVSLCFFIIGSLSCLIGVVFRKDDGITISIFGAAMIIKSAIGGI